MITVADADADAVTNANAYAYSDYDTECKAVVPHCELKDKMLHKIDSSFLVPPQVTQYKQQWGNELSPTPAHSTVTIV